MTVIFMHPLKPGNIQNKLALQESGKKLIAKVAAATGR